MKFNYHRIKKVKSLKEGYFGIGAWPVRIGLGHKEVKSLREGTLALVLGLGQRSDLGLLG